MKILVLNAGSSSLKCELYDARERQLATAPDWEAQADWKELPGPASIHIQKAATPPRDYTETVKSLEHTVEHLLGGLTGGDGAVLGSLTEITVAGHRVVHGGGRYTATTELTDSVRDGIRELAPFAPLHNPLALEAIEAARKVLDPGTVQVAVFDTSFHATLPPKSYLYPGPLDWAARGLRRYGFHGISHQYVGQRAAQLLAPAVHKPAGQIRLITCHLGNGCSLCAQKGGVSFETTMGFTPLEGLMMGSRSGTVDPGLLLYLLKHDNQTADQIDHTLNHESGLKGLSGVSSDQRQVAKAAAEGNADAQRALDVYVYRLAYFISALVPSLGGLDGLVFAGGVGENSAAVRKGACDQLGFLGIALDDHLNALPASDRLLSKEGLPPAVAIIRTRENYQIARECISFARD